MVREAEIKVLSVMDNLGDSGLPEGESERVESVYSGFFHKTSDGVLLTYTEGEGEGACMSEIKYSGGTVSVKRNGAIESELVFEEGKTHTSLYRVPPYTFDAEVVTRRIRASVTDEGGLIELFYNMKIGGAEKTARMKIWISTNSSRG